MGPADSKRKREDEAGGAAQASAAAHHQAQQQQRQVYGDFAGFMQQSAPQPSAAQLQAQRFALDPAAQQAVAAITAAGDGSGVRGQSDGRCGGLLCALA